MIQIKKIIFIIFLIIPRAEAIALEWTYIRICHTGKQPILMAGRVPGKILSSEKSGGWHDFKADGCYNASLLHGDSIEFAFAMFHSERELIPIIYEFSWLQRGYLGDVCIPLRKNPLSSWTASGARCTDGIPIPLSFAVRAHRGGGRFDVNIPSQGVDKIPPSPEWMRAYDAKFGEPEILPFEKNRVKQQSASPEPMHDKFSSGYFWSEEEGCVSLIELFRTKIAIYRVGPNYDNFKDFSEFVHRYGRKCDPEKFASKQVNDLLRNWVGRCKNDRFKQAIREFIYFKDENQISKKRENVERALEKCR